MNKEKLKALAKDLSKESPSSPRVILGGYVILARCLDKCRSFLLGINGEYNFGPCSLCSHLEAFSGVNHDELKDFVATGANDEEVAAWFSSNSRVQGKMELIRWNNKMRDIGICEMDDEAQEYLGSYIPEFVPDHRPVYVWFDVYDLEEGRL